MKNLLCFATLSLLLHGPAAHAAALQSHAEIRAAAEEFVRAQTQSYPGQVTIKVGEPDRRIALPACPSLEAFLPPGAQLLGNSTVGIRCTSGKSWKLFVPVRVTVTTSLVISGRPLRQGQTLYAEDLSTQSGELTHPGMLTDPAQAVGKVVKSSIGAGQVLKQDMLRAPYVVTQGQTVQLSAEGNGFRVRSEGQALNNAAEGQNVQIRTSSGQVVNGVAKADGSVEARALKAPAGRSP